MQYYMLKISFIALKQELKKAAENSDEWRKIKEDIARTDKKIDEEVYKLYGVGGGD